MSVKAYMAIIQHVVLSDIIDCFDWKLASISILPPEFHWMCQKSYSDTGAGAREQLKCVCKGIYGHYTTYLVYT